MGTNPHGVSDHHYDGNVLAGPLAEVFADEMTAALGQCRGCGGLSAVAQWVVYGPQPGLVARCPGCAAVLLRLVRATSATWLDLSGVSMLRLPEAVTP